jgi:hypothetical protein
VVFSTTLSAVQGSNTRLATGGLVEEIERLRAEPEDGDIAVGGATLAASGLIDEYWARVYPVLVGGGTRTAPGRAPVEPRARRGSHRQPAGRLPALPRDALTVGSRGNQPGTDSR